MKLFLIVLILLLGVIALLIFSPLKNSREDNLFRESELIQKTLGNIVKVDCMGSDLSTWYCKNAVFEIIKIVPKEDKLYAYGTGKTDTGMTYLWAGIKTGAFWGDILLESEGEKFFDCEDLKDFPVDIFGNEDKFKMCVENGKIIERTL